LKQACVIGAGIGGLALAIRLQAAGVPTTVIEAAAQPGGSCSGLRRDGFTFDAAPSAINDADGLRALWAISGRALDDDLELLPIEPYTRFAWPDGTVFDASPEQAAVHAAIARINPADVVGYEDLGRLVAAIRADGQARLRSAALLGWKGMARCIPALLRHQAWRPLDATLDHYVASDKLRHALGYPVLRIGGNPQTLPTLLALGLARDPFARVAWPKGGSGALAAAMMAEFRRLGGEARMGEAVTRVATLGTRATGVETARAGPTHFDAVCGGIDAMHLYRDLLADNPRGRSMAKWLGRRTYSPAQFVVHFGVSGAWPGIAHRTVLFGPRHQGWLADLFDHGVLPQDLCIELHHPSVTDASVAPEGMSTFSAVVPVPNLGRLPVDWARIGPVLERRVIDEIGRRLIPELEARIVTRVHRTPVDAAQDWNSHLGSAHGLAPAMLQSGALRPHNRDPVIENLYLVGPDTNPGAGLPGVLAGAEMTATMIIDRLQ
jgi:phytoene desaturase